MPINKTITPPNFTMPDFKDFKWFDELKKPITNHIVFGKYILVLRKNTLVFAPNTRFKLINNPNFFTSIKDKKQIELPNNKYKDVHECMSYLVFNQKWCKISRGNKTIYVNLNKLG